MTTPPRRKVEPKQRWPWQLPAVESADVFALQAIEKGLANSGQQQRALAFIVRALTEERRMSFFPGGEDGRRASDFAEGKRWVGLQIARILKLRPQHEQRET